MTTTKLEEPIDLPPDVLILSRLRGIEHLLGTRVDELGNELKKMVDDIHHHIDVATSATTENEKDHARLNAEHLMKQYSKSVEDHTSLFECYAMIAGLLIE